MSLSLFDAEVFSKALKTARRKKNLTQADCAELLDHSVSFQKDLERGRCSPSIENFYHICRILEISADDCIFYGDANADSSFQTLMRLASQCDERELNVLIATARLLLDTYGNKYPNGDADAPNGSA